MRILFFNRSFYPDITATGQLLTELCTDLVNTYKFRATVITGRPLVDYGAYAACKRKGIINKEQFQGIKILRVSNTTFNPKHFIGRVANYLSYFALSILASFKIDKQDIVVTLTDPPVIPLVGLLVAWRFHIPLVVSVRDIFPEAAAGLKNAQNKPINLLLDITNRFCLRNADLVVTLGKNMRQKLMEDKGVEAKKISVIPDWADCNKILPLAKDNLFSSTHNLAGKFVVMHAGNIGASSGLEFVIESARELRDRKEIVFIFIGEGIMKEDLISLCASYGLENTRFLPFQPKELLSQVFSCADLFLVSLKRGLSGYSLPSKIYTILASGRPYIACVEKDSEVAQLTSEFECGLLSHPQDKRDLSAKIIQLFNDRQLLVRMGKNARKAATLFDRTRGVEKYYDSFVYLHKGKEVI
jgi:glycosyltransferase involved in cell wall biosynthesis